MDPNAGLLSSPSRACPQPAEPCMEGRRSPLPDKLGRDSAFPWNQVPSSSLTDPDWFWDEHIQAKKARVETIVRGMCLSPNPLGPGNAQARESPSCPEKVQERNRKQNLPMQQTPLKPGPAGNPGSRKGSPHVREQLHLLKQQLRQLQEHILQAAEPRDTAQGPGGPEKGRGPLSTKQRNGYRHRPWATDSHHHQGSSGGFPGAQKRRTAEVQYQPEEPSFLPSGTRALLEVLKKELTGAVSQAVDSVLQKVLLDPPGHLTQLGRNFRRLVPEGRSESSPEGGAYKCDPLQLAALPSRAQAQVGVPSGNLSLAKPLDSLRYPVSPRMISKSSQGLPATRLSTVPSHIQENQMLSQLLGHGSGDYWSGRLLQDSSPQGRSSSESALRPWGAVRLPPSVSSQQQHPTPFRSTCLEKQPVFPSVKVEQGGLQAVADVLPFPSVHEGLNPGHLKKAKLMFFFTRYPSSNLLKAYFPDIQFNRCITSQMVKWFSNFREFYYIQMEKFARQAISDGVTNPKMLVVLRDSELFRALNMHYNKGNDFKPTAVSLVSFCRRQVCEVCVAPAVTKCTCLFLTFSFDCDHNGQFIDTPRQVPDGFLEVASLTLQEFFRAVSAGKDSDPSWKKPIYKIISKLDSDIPEIFKSSNYPQELF